MSRPGFGSAISARLFAEEVPRVGPVEWIAAQLGDELWSAQQAVATALAVDRAVAVPAANGVGKSFLAARLAAWWVATHPLGEAIVVVTAPTGRQIDAVLWAELHRAHAAGQLPGEITRGEWRISGTLVALARKSTDFVDAARAQASFQGIHRAAVLVILDEASGIQPWLWRAVSALTTGASARTLAIGNPLDPTGEFARVCEPGSGWRVIPISALDSPAFTEEKVNTRVRDALPSPEWVEEMRRDYGEESPSFRARVEGRFPELGDDGLISAEWVREAQERSFPGNAVPTYGVDVARSGSDETAIYSHADGVVRLCHSARGADLMATTGQIAKLLAATERSSAVIDVIGIGSGVFDRLREQSLPVQAFNAAERASRPDRFQNRRAESYWHLREALREGRVDLDPDDDLLAAQLLSIRWLTNSRGLIQIESKDDARKRGVASPDRADSAAMAVAGDRPRQEWSAAGARSPDDVPWSRFLDEGTTPSGSMTSDLLGRSW